MTNKELELLEEWIDKYGLSDVLSDLATIVYEKADHILETWQDAELTGEWEAAGNEIETLADSIDLPIPE